MEDNQKEYLTFKQSFDLFLEGDIEEEKKLYKYVLLVVNYYLSYRNISQQFYTKTREEMLTYARKLLDMAKEQHNQEFDCQWFTNSIADYLVILVDDYSNNVKPVIRILKNK